MKNGLKAEKERLRKEFLALRAEIPQNEKTDAEKAINARFLSLASFRFADTVLLYHPIKGEPDVLPIFDAAVKAGKKVAFPRCISESCTMVYHYVSDLSELEHGSYGIHEPSPDADIYVPSRDKHDLMIVPAVSFDTEGYRIGYGKGYYDRYLNDFGGTTVGITFHRFLKQSLPRGRYDKAVDLILTEKGAFSVK